MTRMLRSGLFAACAAAAGAALAPCPALAGSYVVPACSPTNSPGVWTQANTFPASFASGNLCGGPEIGPVGGGHEGALYAEDILGTGANDILNEARAGWTFTAPAGATIIAVSYYRNLTAYNDQDLISGLFDAAGTPLEQCKIPWPFPPGSSGVCSKPNNQVPVGFSGLNTTGLFFGVMCRIVRPVLACGSGGTIHAVQADLYSAKVTVSESAAPVVANVAGSAWGGGLVSSTVRVTFAASDASGIRELAVRADTGQTLISVPQPCDVTIAPPCSAQPSAVLNVDTTRVADGPHTFTLAVTDAAGNTQLVTSPTAVVDNNGPPPPQALNATARGPGSNVIALSWSNPPDPPAPITTAMAQLCQTSCVAPIGVGARGAAQLTAPGPGLYSVRLWLLDSASRGGPHNAALATVTVPPAGLAPPPPPSSVPPRAKITAVLKGRQLRVSGPIAVSGRATVSWRSKIRGRTVGHGSRTVTIRNHRVRVTFAVRRRARVAAATLRVVVRRGGRVVAQARARRAR
jgi:hypothetical protein